VTERWDELEARLRVVESRLGIGATDRPPLPDPETFWVLDGLRARGEEGVVFAGDVRTAAGPVAWQYGLPAQALLAPDDGSLDTASSRLAALGHPVRLRLLLAVLRGTTSPAELAEVPGTGTSGQIYHHIRALTAAGWLRSVGRGQVHVPVERVVPLLAALATTL
jgi:DNA-binding transcriptional ArsR family regulator